MQFQKKQKRTLSKLKLNTKTTKPSPNIIDTLPINPAMHLTQQEQDMQDFHEECLKISDPPEIPVRPHVVPKSPWSCGLREKYGLFPLSKSTPGKVTTIVFKNREPPHILRNMDTWDIGDQWIVLSLKPRMYASKLFKMIPTAYVGHGQSLYIATDIAADLDMSANHRTTFKPPKLQPNISSGERIAALLLEGVEDLPHLIRKIKEGKDSAGLAYIIEHLSNIKEVIANLNN